MEDKPLTAKQQAFVEAYTDTSNKTTYNNAIQSAITAGYSEKTVNNNAHQVMGNNGVIEAIRAIQAERYAKTEYNQQVAHGLLMHQYIKADATNDVMAAVACIREDNFVHALRTENINTTDAKAKEIDQAKADEAKRIADIRLVDFKTA